MKKQLIPRSKSEARAWERQRARKRRRIETKPHLGQKRAQIAAHLIQKTLCSYGGGERCDCKFGVVEIGKLTGGEHGCGCPEMYEIEAVIAGLTDRQYREAHHRGRIKILKAKTGEPRIKRAWVLSSPWAKPKETTVHASARIVEYVEQVQDRFPLEDSTIIDIFCSSEHLAWSILRANAQKRSQIATEQLTTIQNKIDVIEARK